MSDISLAGLALALKRSLAFATALVAVALDLLPLLGAAPDTVAPLLALAVVYQWTIRRPDLLRPARLFCSASCAILQAGCRWACTRLPSLCPHFCSVVPRAPFCASL